ncbi:hypothetical protein B0I35DRAFT_479581 [Stachybotrys elegans]|uniref:Zn(2)-C6 fungal-type domain-containing protein n=1 Tax=Stachybotrys elegans TaxID=80388 RepID=A0A8K0SQ38_9HYPO|nr:hypothetical protein B0I35DRAFT_479581 [Stachybotrys elegans]
MVGVPGRSKACSTCRKRRKGCDQQRPACGQCLRARLECGGYERTRVFVQVNPDSAYQATVASKVDSKKWAPPIVLHNHLSRSAFEVGHLANFWQTFLPRGHSDPAQQLGTVDWINSVQQLYVSDRSLYSALMAISFYTVGKSESQRWMMEEGLRQQIASVSSMKHALQSPSAPSGEAIIATARLISLFVILHGENKKGAGEQKHTWIRLVMGELALITSRKPEDFAEGHAHQFFLETRQNLAIIALSMCKTIALNSPEWKTKPWAKIPKLPMDHLIDIIFDIPGMQELTELWVLCPDPELRDRVRRQVVSRAWSMDARLIRWAQDHGPFQSGYDPPSEAVLEEIRNNLGLAYIMSLFWGAQLLVVAMLRSSTPPEEALPERTDMMRYIRFLVMVTPAFYKPHAGIVGSHLVTFAVSTALNFLGTMDRGTELPEYQALTSFLATSGFLKKGYSAKIMDPTVRKCFEWLCEAERRRRAKFGPGASGETTTTAGILAIMDA